MSAPREFFGSRLGFILAAAGSAIGLGNIWRFPYQVADGGGAAFVVLYLFMTVLIGIPMMVAEFILGRRTRSSPIGALRAAGGNAWVPLGFLFVITPLLILAYFSVVAGWTLRYTLDALVGFSPSPSERYAEVSSGWPAVQNHLLMMAVTIAVVIVGVRKGIERAAFVLMPTLAILLIGLAAWAFTLEGSGPGYSFYLTPSIEDLFDPTVIKQAASQAFLSLSVGMGIMLTYGSYISKRENLGREAIVVSFSDFSVAFVGGLVVFPVIFALGLSEEVQGATLGALFISLPGAFAEMGTLGRVIGFSFFLALVIAALTSSVSLLEVGVASIIDEFAVSRRTATLTVGLAVAAVGIIPAMSQGALGVLDEVAGEFLVVVGVLGMSFVVGWVMKDPLSELQEGASPLFRRMARGAIFTIRYVIPPLVAVIVWFSLRDTLALMFG